MPRTFLVIKAEGCKFWGIWSTCGGLSATKLVYFLQAYFKGENY